MCKTMAGLASIASLAFVLAGCNSSSVFSFALEDKINVVFPVSEAVDAAKTAVFEMASGIQRKEIEEEFNARLKERAINCSKGHSFSWYSTTGTILKQLKAQPCFFEADNEIIRWLSMRKVGLLLAKPALRAIPSSAPSFIVASGAIQAVRFASNADIALLESPRMVEVVSLATEKPLFREAKGLTQIGDLSSNGRLFTGEDGNKLKIRDAESGAVIFEIPSARADGFQWLDERTALYNKRDSDRAFLIDFISGREVPSGVNGKVDKVVAVPGGENQYLFFSDQYVTKIKLVRNKAEMEVKLLGEKQVKGLSWSVGTSDTTADGSRSFIASNNLTLVSLHSLGIETISFGPFYLQNGIATPDPDKIILSGIAPHLPGQGQRNFLFSIGNRTLTSIDGATMSAQRYIYIPTWKKQAVVANNKIATVEQIPVLETITLTKFITELQESVDRLKRIPLEENKGQQVLKPVATASGSIAGTSRALKNTLR